MKPRVLIILLALLATVGAFGQGSTDNTVYVKQFQGGDVGTKVAKAMSACNPDTRVPCLLVIDPSLATFAAGNMPALCSQCSLLDYRSGPLSNGIMVAANSPGASAGEKLSTAITAACAAGTKQVDARSIGPVATVNATVVLGCETGSPLRVVFDPATSWVPGSGAVNMFTQAPFSTVEGLTVDVTGVAGYSGHAYQFAGYNYAQQTVPAKLYNTTLRDAFFHGLGNTTGTAIYMAAAGTSTGNMTPIQFVNFENIHVSGFKYARYMTASGSNVYAWINGNLTTNLKTEASVHGEYWIAGTVGGDSANINGNVCVQCSYEGGSVADGFAGVLDAIYVTGPAGHTFAASGNQWLGVQVWDYAELTAVNFQAPANSNRVAGFLTGRVNAGNNIIENLNSPLGPASNQVIASMYDAAGAAMGSARLASTDATHTGIVQLYDPAGNAKYGLGNDPAASTVVSEVLGNGATTKTLWGTQFCVSGNPNGSVCLVAGDATHTGYLAFFNAAGAQTNYIGYDHNGFTGTKTAGTCVLTIMSGIITNVTGC